MSHADEARRIVDAMKTCQTNHLEMWLEPIAAALAAAERRGIEMAAKQAEDIATSLRSEMKNAAAAKDVILASHLSSGLDVLKATASEIRALLPAEPAAKCAPDTTRSPEMCRHEMTDEPYRHCRKCGGT